MLRLHALLIVRPTPGMRWDPRLRHVLKSTDFKSYRVSCHPAPITHARSPGTAAHGMGHSIFHTADYHLRSLRNPTTYVVQYSKHSAQTTPFSRTKVTGWAELAGLSFLSSPHRLQRIEPPACDRFHAADRPSDDSQDTTHMKLRAHQ